MVRKYFKVSRLSPNHKEDDYSFTLSEGNETQATIFIDKKATVHCKLKQNMQLPVKKFQIELIEVTYIEWKNKTFPQYEFAFAVE